MSACQRITGARSFDGRFALRFLSATKSLLWPCIPDCGMRIGFRKSVLRAAQHYQVPWRRLAFGCTGRL